MSDTSVIQARGMSSQLPTPFDERPSDWFMFMPGGEHTLHVVEADSKKSKTVTVQVFPATATAMRDSLEEHLRGKQRPWFDFDHDRKAASAWPLEFAWRDEPTPGVYVRVEWSKSGRAAVEGRDYRAFSPSFLVDKEGVIVGAPKNMGGLVNDPAFEEMEPMWAKRCGHECGPTERNNMTDTELAALQAKLQKLESENTELKAKLTSSDQEAAVAAKETEIASLKQEVEVLRTTVREVRAKEAKIAVDAAVARGAIPPKDEALQGRWLKLIQDNPDNIELLAKLPGRDPSKPVVNASAGAPAEPTPVDAFAAATDPAERTALFNKHRGEIIRGVFAKRGTN